MDVFSRVWNQSFFIPSPSLTEKNLPDQDGRVFIVTGGYAGCGKELAGMLYQRHGIVYVAGRSQDKAEKAIKDLKAAHPSSKGRLEFLRVDLADLATVKPAAEDFMNKENRLDVLTNNAGVMFPPVGSVSTQNHELQAATNVLGPFLLTKLLTPLLEKTAKLPDTSPGSVRVTWGASSAVDLLGPKGGISLDEDGAWVAAHNPHTDYAATKAANVFLATEFARRRRLDGGKRIISNAWNPGNLKSELQRHTGAIFIWVTSWLLHSTIFGGYTELFAGWSEEAGRADKNGAYVIPWGRFGTFRDDIKAEIGKEGGNAEKLWEWCERETKAYC